MFKKDLIVLLLCVFVTTLNPFCKKYYTTDTDDPPICTVASKNKIKTQIENKTTIKHVIKSCQMIIATINTCHVINACHVNTNFHTTNMYACHNGNIICNIKNILCVSMSKTMML